jgi:ATP citrate (pro-S)-lyase
VNGIAQVTPSTAMASLAAKHPFLLEKKLVAKPDQLIKRRGKAGLLKLRANWEEAQAWINERRGREQKVELVSGVLDHFIVEPFVEHKSTDEYYICIHSKRYLPIFIVHSFT